MVKAYKCLTVDCKNSGAFHYVDEGIVGDVICDVCGKPKMHLFSDGSPRHNLIRDAVWKSYLTQNSNTKDAALAKD